MRCKNCGTDLRQADKFCPNCGSNLTDSGSYYQHASQQQSTNNYTETNGVATALNNAFSSVQFLIACICLSVAVFSQLFLLGDTMSLIDEEFGLIFLHVMPILGLIFLWMTYFAAKQSNIVYNSTSIKVLHALSKGQSTITWVTIISFSIILVFTVSGEISFDNLELLEIISKIFMYSFFLGSLYNASLFLAGFYLCAKIFIGDDTSFNFFSGFSSDDAILVCAFATLFLIFANTFITKNLSKCANSLLDSLATGRPTYEKTGSAKIALFIMAGIFILYAFLLSETSSSIILMFAYAGFFISMGLTMTVTDTELSRVPS